MRSYIHSFENFILYIYWLIYQRDNLKKLNDVKISQ